MNRSPKRLQLEERLQLEGLESRLLLAAAVFESEPNDISSSADVFEFGDDGIASLAGLSRSKDDRDFFAFVATKSTTMSASLQTTGSSAQVEIEDSSDREVLELEPEDGVNSGVAQLVAGRLYRVRIRSTSSSASEYSLRLELNAVSNPDDSPDSPPGGNGNPPVASGPVISEVEPNDSKMQSTRFELGGETRLVGSTTHDDRDFFAFTAETSGSLTIRPHSELGAPPKVSIEDNWGHKIFENEPHDGRVSGTADVVAGRTYLLRVRSSDDAAASYHVDLAFAANNGENGLPSSTGTATSNPSDRSLDTTGDDLVEAIDALVVINHLNHRGDGTPDDDFRAVLFDVDQSGSVGPLDALHIINVINRRGRDSGNAGERGSGHAEGEANRILSAHDDALASQRDAIFAMLGHTSLNRRQRSQ